LGELVAMGVIAGLVAFGLAFATRSRGRVRAPTRTPNGMETRVAAFELHPTAARLSVRSRDGVVRAPATSARWLGVSFSRSTRSSSSTSRIAGSSPRAG